MTELWLEFKKDEDGEPERIQVKQEKFVIGRHSDSDLSIPNSVISRQHVSIDSFGEVFVVSDCGSSYGTKLNGAELSDPVGLKNGDTLVLGDEIEIKVEIISDREEEAKEDSAATSSASVSAPTVSASSGGSSIPNSFFIIAPIFALLILLCTGGGLFIAFSGNNGSDNVKKDDYKISSSGDDDEDSDAKKKEDEKKKDIPTPDSSVTPETKPGNDLPTNGTPQNIEIPPPPKTTAEAGNIEQISASFMRRIVKNDQTAFLNSKQIAILTPKVNQFKSSTALAANIKDAKTNSAQITALASQTNLTPQFLATAALAKLGNQRGNVIDTAKSMAEVLDKLNRSIGVESADESLLVIAAYDQGVADKFLQLRNQAEALSKTTQGVTARQVRTIWFLHERGKLTDSEFELALRFLAIGTITQKPSDFSVNAEALNF
jgi:pSer/pThr/pTyr-binding forkhead associated (FHA) protein